MEADQTSTEASACPGCAERDRRIARLEAQVKQLQQHLEALSRSAKRQAAPFSRGLPKVDPKRPGRKSGEDYGTKAFRVAPPVLDEVHVAPLPERWASYDRFWRAIHQTCVAHLLRRCHELLETAVGGAVIFPRKVKVLLQEGLETRDLRDGKQITVRAAVAKADDLQERMTRLLMPVKTHAANERFCRHLLRHTSQLFTFLRQKGIDATNFRAEQAIRPAVVNRKVWGGNRTEAGAEAQSILMTVLFTAAKLKRDALQFVSRVLCSPEQDN